MAYKKKPIPTGVKYHKLTVISEVENTRGDKKRYVAVECECGSTKVVRWDMLKSGGTKSCGCLVSKNAKRQARGMALASAQKRQSHNIASCLGKKYHKLTIIAPYKHPKQKCSWGVVQCDCGTIFKANLARVKHGRLKSCGCLAYDNAIDYVSEVDGEQLKCFGGRGGYQRISSGKNNGRSLIHRHEADKVYERIYGTNLPNKACVHHIDSVTSNNRLDNLCVFEGNGEHKRYHRAFDKAAYQFLRDNELLDDFYNRFPDLQPRTLRDMLNDSKQK